MSYKQERKLANFQEAMNPLVARRELLTVTSHHTRVMYFFTDVIEGCAGVAVHPMGGVGFAHRILSPAGVFTAELSALFTALRHIAEVIRPPERFLVLTDSLSSIMSMGSKRIAHRNHPVVYECKQLCWSLCQNGFEVKLMWILSHVGPIGNELVDERKRQMALEASLHLRPTIVSKRFSECGQTGIFAHSIFPDVTHRPWFEGQKEDRRFVCTVSRVLSGHCFVRLHLGRFRIVEDLMSVCVQEIMRQWTT
jgi:ribonuclease HI